MTLGCVNIEELRNIENCEALGCLEKLHVLHQLLVLELTA